MQATTTLPADTPGDAARRWLAQRLRWEQFLAEALRPATTLSPDAEDTPQAA